MWHCERHLVHAKKYFGNFPETRGASWTLQHLTISLCYDMVCNHFGICMAGILVFLNNHNLPHGRCALCIRTAILGQTALWRHIQCQVGISCACRKKPASSKIFQKLPFPSLSGRIFGKALWKFLEIRCAMKCRIVLRKPCLDNIGPHPRSPCNLWTGSVDYRFQIANAYYNSGHIVDVPVDIDSRSTETIQKLHIGAVHLNCWTLCSSQQRHPARP